MATPIDNARQALAERLRQTRRVTGATGAQFAERLGAGWAQPKVSKLETAKQLPTAADIDAWADATHADAAELLDLLEHARIEYASFRERIHDRGGVDRLQDDIGAAETAATRIAHYQPVLVPAIIQTPRLRPRAAAPTLRARRIRCHRRTNQPHDRLALAPPSDPLRNRPRHHHPNRRRRPQNARRRPRDHERAQREHIARLAETLTTATIAIVPFDAPAPIATLHGWALTDHLATIETDAGNLEIADSKHVERYWQYTGLLLETAVTGPDAANICRRINSETTANSAGA